MVASSGRGRLGAAGARARYSHISTQVAGIDALGHLRIVCRLLRHQRRDALG